AAPVVDNFPAIFTNASWTAVASAGSSVASASGSGNINTTVSLLPGGTVTFTVTGTVAPTATGQLINTATVPAPNGFTDTNPNTNTSSDTDTLTPPGDLQIVKTDNKTSVVPGTTDTYTIPFFPTRRSSDLAAPVVDNFPAIFTNASWTAIASA